MQKVIILSILAILFITNISYADTPTEKALRGVTNVLTCPLEVPYRASEANNKYGIISGLTWGIVHGFYRMGTRAVVGVYEILTCPLNIPKDYGPVIKDPEYFYDIDIFN